MAMDSTKLRAPKGVVFQSCRLLGVKPVQNHHARVNTTALKPDFILGSQILRPPKYL
jgi:hypothetical protein